MHKISGISSHKLSPIKSSNALGSLQKIEMLKGGYIQSRSLKSYGQGNLIFGALSLWLMGVAIFKGVSQGFNFLLWPLRTKVLWLKEEVERDMQKLEKKIKNAPDTATKNKLTESRDKLDALKTKVNKLCKSPEENNYKTLLAELETIAQEAGIQKHVTNKMAEGIDYDAWPRLTDEYADDLKKAQIEKKHIEKTRERETTAEKNKAVTYDPKQKDSILPSFTDWREVGLLAAIVAGAVAFSCWVKNRLNPEETEIYRRPGGLVNRHDTGGYIRLERETEYRFDGEPPNRHGGAGGIIKGITTKEIAAGFKIPQSSEEIIGLVYKVNRYVMHRRSEADKKKGRADIYSEIVKRWLDELGPEEADEKKKEIMENCFSDLDNIKRGSLGAEAKELIGAISRYKKVERTNVIEKNIIQKNPRKYEEENKDSSQYKKVEEETSKTIRQGKYDQGSLQKFLDPQKKAKTDEELNLDPKKPAVLKKIDLRESSKSMKLPNRSMKLPTQNDKSIAIKNNLAGGDLTKELLKNGITFFSSDKKLSEKQSSQDGKVQKKSDDGGNMGFIGDFREGLQDMAENWGV